MASEGSVAVEEERISFSSVESKMASSRLPVEEESARARLQNFRGGLPAFYWDHSLVLYIKLIPRLRSIY